VAYLGIFVKLGQVSCWVKVDNSVLNSLIEQGAKLSGDNANGGSGQPLLHQAGNKILDLGTGDLIQATMA